MPMIIGEIRRYLRDNNAIRVSRSVRDLAYRALSVRERLSKQLPHEPSVDEIASELNRINQAEAQDNEENGKTGTATMITPDMVVNALESIIAPVSLYEPVYGDGGVSDTLFVMDQISDKDGTDESWLENIALKEAMKRLSDRERSIISMRFYDGKTQMEIAREIGISQAQVSRLEKGALDRIKRQM